MVPAPEDCADELDLIRSRAAQIPEPLRAILTQDRPLDFRLIDPAEPFSKPAPTTPSGARRLAWFRLRERIPDAPMLHHAVLAYASDYGFLPTVLRPHGVTMRDPRLFMASLDHTLWLHRGFRADEWLLYTSDAPSAYDARGFVRGQIFAQDGRLVASTAQEGLVRLKE